MIQTVYRSSQTVQKTAHFHDCHQIILVTRGYADFCVNDKKYRACAGDIALFSRYEDHSVIGCSDGYERYVLHIDPDVVNRKSPVYSLTTDRPRGFCNVISLGESAGQACTIFEQILGEQSENERLREEMTDLLVKQLLILAYRCTPFDFESGYDSVVIAVKREFENDCKKQYTLDMLAREHNISVSALSHRFHAVTGTSVMGYLQSCRIAGAKRLLAEGEMPIGEIVERCGFSDCSNFSRTFKALTALTPTQFRKKYKL